MKSLKGTQTEKNILTAFAGESQARNRYDFFAAKAKSDGYVLVRDIFQETALQEKEHAKRLFKFLEGGDVEIVGAFQSVIIIATDANLLASAAVSLLEKQWNGEQNLADVAINYCLRSRDSVAPPPAAQGS